MAHSFLTLLTVVVLTQLRDWVCVAVVEVTQHLGCSGHRSEPSLQGTVGLWTGMGHTPCVDAWYFGHHVLGYQEPVVCCNLTPLHGQVPVLQLLSCRATVKWSCEGATATC